MYRNLALSTGYYAGDDDSDDSFTFDDYVTKTNDPGPWIFIGVSLYSFFCLSLLPIVVMYGNRREKRLLDREEWNKTRDDEDDSSCSLSETIEELGHIGAVETELVENKATKISTVSQRKLDGHNHPQLNNPAFSAVGGYNSSAISAHSSAISAHSKRHRGGRGPINYANLYLRASESEDMHEIKHGARSTGARSACSHEVRDYFNTNEIDDLRPEDAADAHDPGKPIHFLEDEKEVEPTICCGSNAMLSRRNIRYTYGVLTDIAHIDKESKRIIQLCWPMTLSSGIDALFDVIGSALVANYLGTNALIAYIITDLLIGLTDVFLGGPADALNTLCAHAVGAENNHLAGQYVQISAVLYLFLGIPALGVWWVWIGDVVKLMGLERLADIVSQYTKIAVWHYALGGLFEGYNSLLDVCGYVTIGAMFDIAFGFTNLVILWLSCIYWEGFDLIKLAIVELIVSFAFFIGFTIFVACMGWLSPFTDGMLKSCAFRNMNAVKNVVSTAIPLSFGSLLEYGEWEALTFFVAYLGEAEVAAWGLLESLWDFFEAATGGLGEAASIRVAYHLGNGNVNMAKMSSYKSLFMGVSLSFFMTALLFMMGDDLTKWLTPDRTLQIMLNELIPMIGMANVFMIFGMVAWALVGAQGRYKLATTVSMVNTFLVTMPLASMSTFYFTFDLQGIVGAIICGYSTTGLWLGYVLLRSDWEHISQTIREYNVEHDISDSESESESESESDSD